jgi:transcriptional regulator with XRE-family HTH domain
VKPLSRDAPPAAAALGGELRRRRLGLGLTLDALGARSGFSAQHISSLELAGAGATRCCVAALDEALDADGALLELLPAADAERRQAADDRAAARRYDGEDVDPTNRRGLLGGAAGAALTAAAVGPAPVAAREVDPELPAHWERLFVLLHHHDAVYGPRDVMDAVRHERRLIAEYRTAARGELRLALMHVEARWTLYAAWLCEDTGDRRGRDALLERALRLAREADHPDLIAWARARQAQWAEPLRAIRAAEAGRRTPRAGAHMRLLCALRAAHAHAQIGEDDAAARKIFEAESLLEQGSTAQDTFVAPDRIVRTWEARCWSVAQPAKAIGLYEGVLRDWPRDRVCDAGLYRARLALACAAAGELDRARAEGRKALAIAKETKSATATRELKRLGVALAAA